MTADKKDNREEGEPSDAEQGTSALEWIAAGLGALMLAVMIGYMAYVGLSQIDGEPQIALTTGMVLKQGSVHHVAFLATNSGRATASGLVIKAALLQGQQEIESHAVTIDYLPMGSRRDGGFFFQHDPAGYRLEITAEGYVDP